jgi:hypothetical protein
MSNTYPTKKTDGELMCSRRVIKSCLIRQPPYYSKIYDRGSTWVYYRFIMGSCYLLVFCVVFCGSLLSCCCFSFGHCIVCVSSYCLCFFRLLLLVTPLVFWDTTLITSKWICLQNVPYISKWLISNNLHFISQCSFLPSFMFKGPSGSMS